jgi:hypothetical protein
MVKKWIRVLAITAVAVAPLPSAFGQSRDRPQSPTSGIWQLIEERDGKTSCWGAVIQLARLTFPTTLEASDIDITEAKHSSRLNDLMQWKVDSSRKRLTVKFRPGMGDFGTGNRIEIRIKRQALDPTSKGALIWVIETDPL